MYERVLRNKMNGGINMEYCGVYEQGVIVTRDDFDPVKVIPYMFAWYNFKMPKKVMTEIRNNTLTKKHFNYICKKLELHPAERTLQALCNDSLKPYVLDDWFCDEEEVGFGNEMVSGYLYENATGYFHYDNPEIVADEIDGEVIVLRFNVPFAWNITDSIIPASKRMAVFQLQEATKRFLKDNIDWEQRLGCLTIAVKGK